MYKRLNLNGSWQIEPGEEKPDHFQHKCKVPALVDVSKPSINWQDYNYFWYRKDFKIIKKSNYLKICLQLEQVKYGTEIWLNDQIVGGDIPCYTSQEFDLTDFIENNENNILLVRVGSKNTLPAHSAAGSDFEKLTFIPGIWGDVWLHLYGAGKVEWTRIISDIEKGVIHILSEIRNLSKQNKNFRIEYQVLERSNGKLSGELAIHSVTVSANSNSVIETEMKISEPHLWSPETPFLYQLNISLIEQDQISHSLQISFGMRKFEIRNGHFYLNGSRRVLMGSNIAFHRMLSDDSRGTLPWKIDWVKKVLVEIPKSHNMFFFRFHLGHAYNKWYDIADEYGILLQDEWMFWPSTGTPEQIEKEFRAWIKENCNHPSIIIWDPLNESTDRTITDDIIPKLKKLDPTRPWESVDFIEDHPYIYSLGPVLNGKKFGFSRSIFELQCSKPPSMVSEYLWWWIDKDGEPTAFTKIVLERWMGKNPSKKNILHHQDFLIGELTELWRRLNLDAIMPFVYLSMGIGPTANWFLGPLKELKLKPIVKALKNAFSPVGVSIELWDRHFVSGEQRKISIYIFNDTLTTQTVTLQLYVEELDKFTCQKKIHLAAGEHHKIKEKVTFPQIAGQYVLNARLILTNGKDFVESSKPVLVFEYVNPPKMEIIPRLSLNDPSGEIQKFLTIHKYNSNDFPNNIENSDVLLINGTGLDEGYRREVPRITEFVKQGGVLILQEPELGVQDESQFLIVDNVNLNVKYRKDPERGGYDSYVFPAIESHYLWKELHPEYFKIFNGALGGEIVSQYLVMPSVPYHIVASCNLSLAVPAVMEIPYGEGWIVISRIQFRGRLLMEKSNPGIYDRRYDPVAEKYFWNLITQYVGKSEYQKKIKTKISHIKIFISKFRTSTQQIYDTFNAEMVSRWNFKSEKFQWLWIDFGKLTYLNQMSIQWETTYSKTFEILESDDDENWNLVFREKKSWELIDQVKFKKLKTRFIKINYDRKDSQNCHSIWKIKFM